MEWLGTGNTSRRAKGGAAYALAQVTDAAVREKWKQAEKHMARYLKERPDSFVGYSWMGMIKYFQFQDKINQDGQLKNLNDPEPFAELFASSDMLERCTIINRWFSPCWLWMHRTVRTRTQ